jgi:hypothetical protein
MSYLRYLCLFVHGGFNTYCVVLLFCFFLVYTLLPVSLDYPVRLPLRYSLGYPV